MNDDKLKYMIDQAFQGDSPKPPEDEMWRNIQAQLPATRRASGRWPGNWWLIPAGAAGVSALALLVFTQGPNPGGAPEFPPQSHATGPGIEYLRTQAPDVYAQNRTAIEALDTAIREILTELETRPDDNLLRSRLVYYRKWQSEMVTELVDWTQEKADAAI